MRVTAATRQELINKSLGSAKGTQRYYRRLFSQVKIPSQGIAETNVAKWFETDILDTRINVKGETNSYEVAITFYGVWDSYDKTKACTEHNIKNAITRAYQSQDIYVACTCKDWRYRFAYVATRGNYAAERKENRPAKITNPNDSLGATCKHVLLCLVQSHRWIDQLSKITYKYIQLIKRRQPRLYDLFIKDRIENEREEIEETEETEPIEDIETTEEVE